MFEKPSIFKVPTISSNGYDNAACGPFNPQCNYNFTANCVDNYVAPPPPPEDDSCGTGFGVGVGGIAITAVGSIAAVLALT